MPAAKAKAAAKPKTAAKPAAPQRLIQEFETNDENTMTDALSIAARDIEDALLQCGAVPGKDYTYLDLFKQAVELVTAVTEEAMA